MVYFVKFKTVSSDYSMQCVSIHFSKPLKGFMASNLFLVYGFINQMLTKKNSLSLFLCGEVLFFINLSHKLYNKFFLFFNLNEFYEKV